MNNSIMEEPQTPASTFIDALALKAQHRIFVGKLLSFSVGYLLITLLLNNIRATGSLWLIWPLIIVQFVLYFSIFIVSYKRAVAIGWSKGLSAIAFVILAIVGRVNNWEILVLPVFVIGMIILSIMNKKAAKQGNDYQF